MVQEIFSYRKRSFQVVYFPWYLVITETTHKLFRNVLSLLGRKGRDKTLCVSLNPSCSPAGRKACAGQEEHGNIRNGAITAAQKLNKRERSGWNLRSPTEEQRQAGIAPLSCADKATFQTQAWIFFFSTTEISGKP